MSVTTATGMGSQWSRGCNMKDVCTSKQEVVGLHPAESPV